MAIFMKYGALDGEVTATGYEKWVELHSFQWGAARGISGGVGGKSKREATAPSIAEVTVSKTFDSFSPLALKESIGGKATKVDIHFTQTDQAGKHVAYQKYQLENSLISSYSMSTGGDRPSESMSLNFTKVDSEYFNIDDQFAAKTTGHIAYDLSTATS